MAQKQSTNRKFGRNAKRLPSMANYKTYTRVRQTRGGRSSRLNGSASSTPSTFYGVNNGTQEK